MLKNFSKLLFLLLTISIIFSISICHATEAVTTSETDKTPTPETSSDSTTLEDNNYYGDLYIFDNEVVVDKVVYGNVYIVGNKVEITGQIEGNLFILAKDLKLDKSYIGGSLFACADTIYYNAASTYLYSISNKLEMTYDSYVVRDAKIKANDSTIKSAIGRNLDLISSNIDLGEGENIPIIYGNLRYSAPAELEIPEGVITENGIVNYTPMKAASESSKTLTLVNILCNFITYVITALVICLFISKFAPNFNKKLEQQQITFINLLKYLGIGALSILVVIILFILLLLSQIGIKLAFILLLLFVLLSLISIPIYSIIIANYLKPIFKIEKNNIYYLVISLINIIICGLMLIPIINIITSLIINPIAIGSLIYIFIPHKEITNEEKVIKEEKKKETKLNKEKIKQEKLDAKNAKKQAKLEAKEAKKKDNTDL